MCTFLAYVAFNKATNTQTYNSFMCVCGEIITMYGVRMKIKVRPRAFDFEGAFVLGSFCREELKQGQTVQSLTHLTPSSDVRMGSGKISLLYKLRNKSLILRRCITCIDMDPTSRFLTQRALTCSWPGYRDKSAPEQKLPQTKAPRT